jgi:amino acid adenylation domain-containing protein
MIRNNILKCKALHAGFYNSSDLFPDAVAIDIGGTTYNYKKLRNLSLKISNTINASKIVSTWIGLLVNKSIYGYAAILGVLTSGKGYMPLSLDSPIDRLIDMVKRSKTKMLIVDPASIITLDKLLTKIEQQLTICIVTDIPEEYEELFQKLSAKYLKHHFVGIDTCKKVISSLRLTIENDEPAYLLFTSGSTGRPKGVIVSHGNVRHFIDSVVSEYKFKKTDRFSQNFSLTFDLSVFDIFVAFEVGACLCPPNDGDKILPKKYINKMKLTVWFSVPSVIKIMQDTNQLNNNVFRTLRYSLFCGEALMVKPARIWQKVAPYSKVINLYGPTEATICCTAFTWIDNTSYSDEDFLPIGKAFAGLYIKILDETLSTVDNNIPGELWVGGPQVAKGYLDDDSETKLRFVYDEQHNIRYYRTGDRVYRDEDSRQLCFIGRVDHQVKIRGFRIELGEIEHALRKTIGCSVALAIPWPNTGLHDRVIAVLLKNDNNNNLNSEKILYSLRDILPDYMVPSNVIRIDRLPLSSNGKIDRSAIADILYDEL